MRNIFSVKSEGTFALGKKMATLRFGYIVTILGTFAPFAFKRDLKKVKHTMLPQVCY